MRPQRTLVRRQFQGEHRHRSVGEVNAGAAQERFAIDCRASRHVVAHVRDVDLQREIAVRKLLHPNRVVKIARRLAIDRHDVERPKIAALCDLYLWNRTRNRPRLLQYFVGKLMRDVMRPDENLDIDAEIVGLAEDLGHAADRAFAVAEIEDLHVDDHALKIRSSLRIDLAHAHTIG